MIANFKFRTLSLLFSLLKSIYVLCFIFPLLCVEYISTTFFSSHDLIDLLQNSQPLSTNILFGLRLDSLKFV